MAAPSQVPRAVPPLRRVILRITFVAPLWGVAVGLSLIAIAWTSQALMAGEGVSALFGALGFVLFALIPALLICYPVGLVVAFLTSLLLVLVVRRFGWSRRNALLSASASGLVLSGASLLIGDEAMLVISPVATCLGAGALTWWSSLRGLLSGTSNEVADVFS